MKRTLVSGLGWKRAGISNALVAILLIVVAVAVVGIAWAVISGFIGTGSVKTEIAIEKLDLVANGRSVVVVRNLGNVRIIDITGETLTCDATSDPSPPDIAGPIDPGETVTTLWDYSGGAGGVPGETCTLTIQGTAVNGAVVAASGSAIVRP